ncbi:MAG: hypothetical protein KAI25_02290 [Hyphomicrobiaceae bacterium]|nr:hypothetical protein [Hyphomicrobiaceae bacterium]
MTLNEFIRSLTKQERQKLAEQAGCSFNYLNNLTNDNKLASLELTSKIFRSSFNKNLPKEERFLEPDYLAYRTKIRAHRKAL